MRLRGGAQGWRCPRLGGPPLSLGAREVLVGGHPVAQFVGDRLEVARASKLLGAEAFGHLACELRDVALLGRLDEDSLDAERLQLGCSGSAAFRIPLNPRHLSRLRARDYRYARGATAAASSCGL